MDLKKVLLSLILSPFAFFLLFVGDVNAQDIFGIVIPETYDNTSVDIFGANNTANDFAVAANEDLTDLTSLTSDANGDRIFGTAPDSTGSFVYLVAGADENPIGGGWNMTITKVNMSAVVQAGWPVLFDAAGGLGGAYSANGFVEMIPDNSGGVYVLYYVGTNDPPGPPDSTRILQITHFTSGGTETAGFPISLGDTDGDMIPDGAGGVYVQFGMGPDILSAGLSHGSVRHITTAGVDAAWAGGSTTFVVSTENTTEKRGAMLMSDGLGGGIVLWTESDGLYGQRFSSAGLISAGWATRGNQIYANNFLGSFTVQGANSGDGGPYYVAFSELFSGINVLSFDGTGSQLWGCVQTLVQTDDYLAIGSRDATNPGVYIVFEDGNVFAQLFAQSTGNSFWQNGGEEISGGSDVDFVFPDDAFIENKSSGTVVNSTLNGFHTVYSNSDSGNQEPVVASVIPTSFPAGPGNDCTVLTAPDAPVILGIAGNEEIQVDFPEPADNGSTITQYEVRYGPKAGFPGNEVTVVVPYVAGAVSYTITGLTNGTEYSVRVFATNAGGLSAASNVVDVTPGSIGNRRRDRAEIGKAAAVYLGNKYAAADEAQEMFNSLFHGAASFGDAFGLGEALGLNAGELSEIVYQSASGGEEFRRFSEDEGLQNLLIGNKENILTLLDLLTRLRILYGFMQSPDYDLLITNERVAEVSRLEFLKRNFLHLVGVKYFAFDTEFREDLDKVLDILVDWEKALVIKFGQVCYDESAIEYMRDLDYPDSPNWFHRYKEKSREWVTGVLDDQAGISPGFVDWLKVDDKIEDPLKAYYQFVFGYCLAEVVEL